MKRRIPSESEPWSAPQEHLALLTKLSGRLEPDDPELASWARGYLEQHLHRLAADLQLVERDDAEPGARVLEYGAVPLLLTAALAERGYRVSALDLAPERFSRVIAELNLDVAKCDVERELVPYREREFELVLFNELFEHLRIDPIFTLEEAYRVLSPGGRLLLSTPNLRSLRGLKNLLVHHRAHASSGDVYRQYEKLRTLGHMGHVREYTVRELTEFLERVGFQVERIVYRGGHGAGLVGLVERATPSLRPFFTIVASRPSSESARSS